MKLTKNQEEFIGTEFATPKGGVLKVVGVDVGNTHTIKFILECSICSEDSELFPDKFLCSKSKLKNGKVPCGCSPKPQWEGWQDEILTQRILDTLPYPLKVIRSVETKNKPRKFILRCDTCSQDEELWPEGSIQSVKSSLLLGKTSCGCGGAVKWTEDQYKILIRRRCEKYGYIFKGWIGNYKGRNTKLDLHNPSTNNSWKSNTIKEFLKGRIDPLVSKRKRWTQEEREYQIHKRLQEEGGKFLKWSSIYKNSGSKFKWLCNNGHLCETGVSKFCNSGQRCMVCRMERQKERKNYYGYFPERVTEVDNLYVIRFKKDKIIKVGRAFDLYQRMYTQSHSLLKTSNHKENEVEVLRVFTGLHQEIFDTEQWVHERLTDAGFHDYWVGWTTEAFTEDSEDLIDSLLTSCNLIRTL